MGTAVYTGTRAELRILDGNTTPNYLVIPYVQFDLAAPLNRARPEQILRMNRGRIDAFTHLITGPDDPIVTGIELSFSCWLDEQIGTSVLAALGNPFRAAIWSVGTSVFVTAAGTGASILNGVGTSVPIPQAADTDHRRMHLEGLYKGKTAGTNDRGFRYEEVYFPPDRQRVNEAQDGVILNAVAVIYGRITSISAFTAGTNLTPTIT